MAITLGPLTFDETQTTVHEQHDETGGRRARHITIAGIVRDASTVETVEARLDAILDAASSEGLVALTVRPGRRVWVRRLSFAREVARDPLVGSFTLQLEAPNPCEESVATHQTPWPIAASGAAITLASAGNVPAPAIIAITAWGRLVAPSFSDGTATIAYDGVVDAGETLFFDGVASRVLLDGVEVTPYTSGSFPRIAPDGTTLTYADHASSAHTGAAVVSHRDAWW